MISLMVGDENFTHGIMETLTGKKLTGVQNEGLIHILIIELM